MKRIIKQCSSKKLHKNKSSSSWSDLGVDLLIEINKKLCNYGDHIRFCGVCKTWRAVGHDDIVKRAGDVLPWLTVLDIDYNMKKLSYRLYEPLDPIKPHIAITTISHTINLGDYFDDDDDDDISHIFYYNTSSHIRYVDGWLHICVYNYKSKSFNFLFFSLATKSSFTLPQLNVSTLPMHLALSTTPDSPDCVFLALHLTDDYTRTISIFRHGDTHWNTTKSVESWSCYPRYNAAAVFIRGVFYFFSDVGIGSYDLATGELKLDRYSTMLESNEIYSFFGLDGDLMLAYKDQRTRKLCIRKYDWSRKVWVPLQSLDGRSLYLSRHSVYVDHINYYGISSSANKIYLRDYTTSCVDEYTLEDGQLSKCPSARRLRSWCIPTIYTSWDIWVGPPDLLLRK